MAEELNATPQGQENSTPETEQKQGKFYTEEELDLLIQKISDKRVTQALATQEKRNAQKMKEAEKLAAMSERERYEYQLSERERLLEEKERQLTLECNRNEANKILADKGLSLTLVDFILADDAETMNANIKKLERAFKASVENEVKKRLGGNTPQTGTAQYEAMTKDDYRKLSLDERQRLKDTDPELYNSLKISKN